MSDPQGKGPSCTVEAASSEAQMTKQDGLSNGGPLFQVLHTEIDGEQADFYDTIEGC